MPPTDDQQRPPAEQTRPSPIASHHASADRSRAVLPARTRVWTSEELLGDEVEVVITHEDQQYRLRRTRNGKLILCK